MLLAMPMVPAALSTIVSASPTLYYYGASVLKYNI